MNDTALATEIRDLLRRLLRECEIIAEELHRANVREARPEPPPVCTGSGLQRRPDGTCPICGVACGSTSIAYATTALYSIPFMTCAPHPYVVRVSVDEKEADRG